MQIAGFRAAFALSMMSGGPVLAHEPVQTAAASVDDVQAKATRGGERR